MSHIVALAIAIVLTGVSHVILRKGAISSKSALHSLISARTIIGYGMFGAVTVLMVYAAQTIPLRSLTAWSSLSNLITVALAVILLKERPDPKIYAGALLVTLGLIVFSIG